MPHITRRFLLLGALSIVACAPSAAPLVPVPDGRALIVTSTLTYFTLDQVPRPLADFVAGALSGPVYFAVSNGSYCAVDVGVFTHLRVGQSYTCQWRPARGV
jgi:hypothetical protein